MDLTNDEQEKEKQKSEPHTFQKDRKDFAHLTDFDETIFADAALPRYQGIEVYMALRRLKKAVWILNYNENHTGPSSVKTASTSKPVWCSFFDYYLKEAAEPDWMSKSIPVINKKGSNIGCWNEST